MINENQISKIKKQEKVIFVTSSKLHQPRAIYVVPSRITKEQIIISNIQMQKSIKNIKENNKCFINSYIPEEDLQIKIEGEAEVFESGNLFEEIKAYEETENLPPELKVNSIILINIKSVEETRE